MRVLALITKIQKESTVSPESEGFTPVSAVDLDSILPRYACHKGTTVPGEVSTLINPGANVNGKSGDQGLTPPLYCACSMGTWQWWS